MEGLIEQEKIIPVEEGTRQEKIESAEKSMFDVFDRKLAEVLNRIGENPYFETERGF